MKPTPLPSELRHARLLFNERVSSLLDDGYHIMFRSSGVTDTLWLASLRHHNGNRVIIKAYPYDNRLVQTTNHIVTHEGKMY